MSKSSKIWLAIGIAIIVILLVVGHSAEGNNQIKIGVIAPLTGTFALNGEEARNAILLAVDQINASGGVLGKKIDAVVEDGKCDTPTALSAWQKLVSSDGVHIVLGGHCSSETLAIAPLASTDRVLTLANITSASSIPNEGEWVFRNSSPSQYVGSRAADYAVKTLGYKRIGVVSENKDFPLTYSEYFVKTAEADGATIVYNEQFQPGTTDFRSIITKVKDEKVDAVLISTQGASTAGIYSKQLHDLGSEMSYIYNAGFDLTAFKQGSAAYTPQKFVVVTGYANPADQNVKNFVDAYTQKYNTGITYNLYYVSATYDMVMRMKDAMVACNSTTDIECVRNQFKNATSYNGVSGIIQISSKYSPDSSVMPLGVLILDNKGNPLVTQLNTQ